MPESVAVRNHPHPLAVSISACWQARRLAQLFRTSKARYSAPRTPAAPASTKPQTGCTHCFHSFIHVFDNCRGSRMQRTRRLKSSVHWLSWYIRRRRGCKTSSWMEISDHAVVVNLAAAVKITGASDTEGPLRRLCGEVYVRLWDIYGQQGVRGHRRLCCCAFLVGLKARHSLEQDSNKTPRSVDASSTNMKHKCYPFLLRWYRLSDRKADYMVNQVLHVSLSSFLLYIYIPEYL